MTKSKAEQEFSYFPTWKEVAFKPTISFERNCYYTFFSTENHVRLDYAREASDAAVTFPNGGPVAILKIPNYLLEVENFKFTNNPEELTYEWPSETPEEFGNPLVIVLNDDCEWIKF